VEVGVPIVVFSAKMLHFVVPYPDYYGGLVTTPFMAVFPLTGSHKKASMAALASSSDIVV